MESDLKPTLLGPVLRLFFEGKQKETSYFGPKLGAKQVPRSLKEPGPSLMPDQERFKNSFAWSKTLVPLNGNRAQSHWRPTEGPDPVHKAVNSLHKAYNQTLRPIPHLSLQLVLRESGPPLRQQPARIRPQPLEGPARELRPGAPKATTPPASLRSGPRPSACRAPRGSPKSAPFQGSSKVETPVVGL